MKTVLITGSSGFIGRRLISTMTSDFKVLHSSSSTVPVHDQHFLESFEKEKIDYVFHLAGLSYVPDSWKRPFDFINVNVLGTTNVMEVCRRHGAKLTFVSSYLYGMPEDLPINEEAQVRILNPYGLSKKLAEEVVNFYATNWNINSVIIRPFNIYGPGQRHDFLIPTLIRQALDGGKIEVNDLRPRRDYVYVDDFVDALLKTMNSPGGNEIINIGYGKSYSVQDLIGIVEDILGIPIEVCCKHIERQNEVFDVVADISKARQYLDWWPKTSINEGLSQCVTYFKKGQ